MQIKAGVKQKHFKSEQTKNCLNVTPVKFEIDNSKCLTAEEQEKLFSKFLTFQKKQQKHKYKMKRCDTTNFDFSEEDASDSDTEYFHNSNTTNFDFNEEGASDSDTEYFDNEDDT